MFQACQNKTLRIAVILVIIIAIGTVYAIYDPALVPFFPQCPFYKLTGLKCPGCGSQRALHELLNLKIADAFKENSLMMISMPYVILGFVMDRKSSSEKINNTRKILFGRIAIFIILTGIILFWIIRNV